MKTRVTLTVYLLPFAAVCGDGHITNSSPLYHRRRNINSNTNSNSNGNITINSNTNSNSNSNSNTNSNTILIMLIQKSPTSEENVYGNVRGIFQMYF